MEVLSRAAGYGQGVLFDRLRGRCEPYEAAACLLVTCASYLTCLQGAREPADQGAAAAPAAGGAGPCLHQDCAGGLHARRHPVARLPGRGGAAAGPRAALPHRPGLRSAGCRLWAPVLPGCVGVLPCLVLCWAARLVSGLLKIASGLHSLLLQAEEQPPGQQVQLTLLRMCCHLLLAQLQQTGMAVC